MTKLFAQTQIPVELKPAYDRPVDKASIDQRMSDQLAFESLSSRHAPHELNLGDDSVVKAEANPMRSGNRLKKVGKRLAVSAGVVLATVAVGKAIPDAPKPDGPRPTQSIDYVGHGWQPNNIPPNVGNAETGDSLASNG